MRHKTPNTGHKVKSQCQKYRCTEIQWCNVDCIFSTCSSLKIFNLYEDVIIADEELQVSTLFIIVGAVDVPIVMDLISNYNCSFVISAVPVTKYISSTKLLACQ